MRGLNITVVDWSAASRPTPARDSADAIWIGLCTAAGERQIYCRTRAEAEARIIAETATGEWLVGFDFPMGYPAGFAARLTGQATARSLHDWLERAVQDGPDNANNRFELAAAINRRLGGGGPFWGCPVTVDLPGLPRRKIVDYAALGLTERRGVEQRIRRAQPVWKLYTTGSVGSQSLTGLPVVARLARRPGTAVWPFEPPARITLAEVYPSLLDAEVRAEGDAVKDRAQVRLLARALYRLAGAGHLPALLECPPEARSEEGWVLGAGQEPLLRAGLA
ncbi:MULTISPECIES: hypothetical protein [Gemmobacter]|uniref:DUF429 domain-containing protein n=1 Tax=Gemmobacter caeni TaxID=589035 RepID=A0A2T6B561_9RHOB|nr:MULTISPECIES: hypothetical protein [Gemmobacter]PTX51216.1 hypothetical protein C8N34_104336 [Gemmobacter caeni]TWJ01216.1 molybdopterin-guanine dinucleotide biosynthesis protein B [Gemmobacter caeni]